MAPLYYMLPTASRWFADWTFIIATIVGYHTLVGSVEIKSFSPLVYISRKFSNTYYTVELSNFAKQASYHMLTHIICFWPEAIRHITRTFTDQNIAAVLGNYQSDNDLFYNIDEDFIDPDRGYLADNYIVDKPFSGQQKMDYILTNGKKPDLETMHNYYLVKRINPPKKFNPAIDAYNVGDKFTDAFYKYAKQN